MFTFGFCRLIELFISLLLLALLRYFTFMGVRFNFNLPDGSTNQFSIIFVRINSFSIAFEQSPSHFFALSPLLAVQLFAFLSFTFFQVPLSMLLLLLPFSLISSTQCAFLNCYRLSFHNQFKPSFEIILFQFDHNQFSFSKFIFGPTVSRLIEGIVFVFESFFYFDFSGHFCLVF